MNFTLGSQAHRRIKRVLNPGSIHLITLSCRFLITRKEPSDYKRHTEPKLDLSSRVTSSVTCQCMTHAPNIYGKEYFITSMRFRFLWLSRTMTVRTPETRTWFNICGVVWKLWWYLSHHNPLVGVEFGGDLSSFWAQVRRKVCSQGDLHWKAIDRPTYVTLPQAGVKRIGTLILHKTLSHQVFTSRFYCGLDSKVGGIEVEKFNLMQSMYRVVFNCPHLFSTAKKIGQREALQDEELHWIAVLPSWLEAVFLLGTEIRVGPVKQHPVF